MKVRGELPDDHTHDRLGLEPHTLRQIVEHFTPEHRHDELDGSTLVQWPDDDTLTPKSTFYVLPNPPPVVGEDGEDGTDPDWQALGPEIAAIAEARFDPWIWGYLGHHLVGTIELVQDVAPGSSSETTAEAFIYYLERDTWPDWLA